MLSQVFELYTALYNVRITFFFIEKKTCKENAEAEKQ